MGLKEKRGLGFVISVLLALFNSSSEPGKRAIRV